MHAYTYVSPFFRILEHIESDYMELSFHEVYAVMKLA